MVGVRRFCRFRRFCINGVGRGGVVVDFDGVWRIRSRNLGFENFYDCGWLDNVRKIFKFWFLDL